MGTEMVIGIKILSRQNFNKLINTLLLKTLLCTSILLCTFSSFGQHKRIESPFNGVMLVTKNGKVLLKKAYGFHDKDKNINLTTSDRFLIGSVTKQFTAMLVMQQVDIGNLELDKAISDYLPYFPKDKGKKLTIHRLLSHTSGLPHYEGLRRLNIPLEKFRESAISVESYAQLISNKNISLTSDESSEEVVWLPIEEIKNNYQLTFDHNAIFDESYQRLKSKVQYTSLPINLLPEIFTLSELQKTFEFILGYAIEKKSFRRRLLAVDIIAETGEMRVGSNRPAKLYCAKSTSKQHLFQRSIEGPRE